MSTPSLMTSRLNWLILGTLGWTLIVRYALIIPFALLAVALVAGAFPTTLVVGFVVGTAAITYGVGYGVFRFVVAKHHAPSQVWCIPLISLAFQAILNLPTLLKLDAGSAVVGALLLIQGVFGAAGALAAKRGMDRQAVSPLTEQAPQPDAPETGAQQ